MSIDLPSLAVMQLADGVVDLHRGEVRRAGSRELLTPTEVGLLSYLGVRPGGVVSKDTLLAEGGFTLAAAEQVLAPAVDGRTALELVDALFSRERG